MCNSSKSLLIYLIYDSYYIPLFFISAALKRIRVYIDELQGYIVIIDYMSTNYIANVGVNQLGMVSYTIKINSYNQLTNLVHDNYLFNPTPLIVIITTSGISKM